MENIELLVKNLCNLASEQSWCEFKHNNENPETIAMNISALANIAAYENREKAYIIWGVEDKTHRIIGTSFDPSSVKKGNQNLEIWLREVLSSNCEYEFHSSKFEGNDIVVLIISKAMYQPVTCKTEPYIRVGSSTKALKDVPTMQATLWDRLRSSKFEDIPALTNLTLSEALNKLDFTVYFENKAIPLPSNFDGMMHYMLEDSICVKQDNGLYSITNLGAILLAKKIKDFPTVAQKVVRLIQYEGKDRYKILKDYTGEKGYVVGFTGLISTLENILPSSEEINGAVRKTKTAYPVVVLRELIANAMIHQNFSVSGAKTLIEIFEDRIEITNPGTPLIDINRIIDNPPRSRNEKLSSLMRNLKLCEEMGSGWDRIVIECELDQLFAPKFIIYEESTRVIIHEKRNFSTIPMEDKIWTCYLHACIKYVNSGTMTNASLRERFGLDSKSSSAISRLIKETLEKGYIKPLDAETAPRHMQYIPIWA